MARGDSAGSARAPPFVPHGRCARSARPFSPQSPPADLQGEEAPPFVPHGRRARSARPFSPQSPPADLQGEEAKVHLPACYSSLLTVLFAYRAVAGRSRGAAGPRPLPDLQGA